MAIKPVAWQPGTVMRLEFFIRLRCSFLSSGRPYTQPSATRYAVEPSMTHTDLLLIRLTDSRAALSGKQRKTMSASFSSLSLAVGSLRLASGISISSMSFRAFSRSWIFRPVVPCCPSIKTVFFIMIPFLLFQVSRVLVFFNRSRDSHAVIIEHDSIIPHRHRECPMLK